ncbi:hypothetical protein [Corynebacterium epidermidicanis]|uniref:Uncharacterized protein n=1 Tax=Corynebacterium epidermidicanis TaxID=1050174 RepID=A0A0G3GRY9_9CORY|nr:hypothetical protein [Corynebacterium epidermidicanis]AKK03325.1 hypothetical protein CEPID_07370 [Corynebacterium epidermidicanis]
MTTVINRNRQVPTVRTETVAIVQPASVWDGGALATHPSRDHRVRSTHVDFRRDRPADERAIETRSNYWGNLGNGIKQLILGGIFGSAIVIGLLLAGPEKTDSASTLEFGATATAGAPAGAGHATNGVVPAAVLAK